MIFHINLPSSTERLQKKKCLGTLSWILRDPKIHRKWWEQLRPGKYLAHALRVSLT